MQTPRDFSMYGAVDLGARQAAAQRRQQQAALALGPAALDKRAPVGFEFDEPAGDAFETRPPEGPDARPG